jgi:hypothetical protein
MEGCTRFHEYVTEELRVVGAGIEQCRRAMSRELGRKVTKREAQSRYAEENLQKHAAEFRRKFCGACPDRSGCTLRREKEEQ